MYIPPGEMTLPQSIAQMIYALNQDSGGKHKLFAFALVKREFMGNTYREVIRASYAISTDMEAALSSILRESPILRKFEMAHYVETDLGENPMLKLIVPKLDTEKDSVVNTLKLIRDNHAEGAYDRGLLTSIIKRFEKRFAGNNDENSV